MSDKIKLTASKRIIVGRKVKKLRKQGVLPGNIYGKDIKSLAIKLSTKDFQKTYSQVGETGIIDLQINKETKTRPVLISDTHVHPVTDEILHIDFHQVDLTKKVTVNIPVELVKEAPAVSKGGVLLQLISEIEVEALPTDLPDKFTINVSKLEEIGQGISLKDIKVDSKVKILIDNLDELVVKIEEPTKEEEKPEEVTPIEGEESEAPVEGKESEAPAEGEEGGAKEGDSKEDKSQKPEAKHGSPDKGGKSKGK